MKTDPPRRRWLRFSLRSLFLLTLVLAAFLAWMTYKARQQGIAVAALKEMGCNIAYDYADDRSPTVLERLRKLLGEEEPRSITGVSGSLAITDAALVHIGRLTQLQGLDLQGARVTDAGLAHLRGLTHLYTLNLSGSKVTGAGLVHLR